MLDSLRNSDDVENLTGVGATNCTPRQQIKPKHNAAPIPTECRDAGVVATEFESASQAGKVSSTASLHHWFHALNSGRPRTDFDGDIEAGGEDCVFDDTEVLQRASVFFHVDDLVHLVPCVNAADFASENDNKAIGSKTTTVTVVSLHTTSTPLMPRDHVGADTMPKPATLRGIPRRRIGQSPSRQTPYSFPLPWAATPIAIDTLALPAICQRAADPQSESELDDDFDDDSGNDSGDEHNSDVEYNSLAQFELSNWATPVPGFLPSTASPVDS